MSYTSPAAREAEWKRKREDYQRMILKAATQEELEAVRQELSLETGWDTGSLFGSIKARQAELIALAKTEGGAGSASPGGGSQEMPAGESGVFPEGMSLEEKNEALYFAYLNLMDQYYPVQDSFDFQGEANSQAAEDLQWIAQDATAAGMTIGEYFEAHPEKRPDWLNRIYYGEYAKRYGMPITQKDTWTLDALRPEEDNLAAINELLAENGLPPLKSVDWPVVEDALLANITENDIMGLYEPGQPEAEAGAEDEGNVTPGDLFPVVMTPEQQKYLAEKNDQVLGLLTDEQKQRIRNGENIFSIIDELDPDKQTQIGELAQKVLSVLDEQQKTELMFLGSGLMEGLDLDTRLVILKHLKDNGGEITYDDLVEIGVYAPGTLAEGGLLRWLANFDIGGPAHFGGLLAKEYRLNQFGTSFALLDQEERMRRGVEMTMLFAMAAAPLLDRVFNGSSRITLDPNKRLEGIELKGWNIKGSPSYIDAPEVGGATGNNLVFGSEAKSANKLQNQMNSRGWSRETVQSTYSGPFTTRPSTNVATGNPATAYFNKDGSYVVVDDITHEVVQVSKRFDRNWIPDPNITDPYLP